MPLSFKEKLLVSLILFGVLSDILPNAAAAQNLNLAWVKQAGGTTEEAAHSIAGDAAGNIYTCGVFSGTCDFDPGPGVYNLVSNGNIDIYISKMDDSGNLLWAKSMGGPNADQATSIATDAGGNVFVTGFFFNTVDFDPGPGLFNLTAFGQQDVFVCRLDAVGNFVWARQMGGSNYDQAWSLTLDAANNVYTCGEFASTVADFDPGAGVFNLNNLGSTNAFISKLDASGNFVWAKHIGGTSIARARSLITDAGGNLLVTGNFYDTNIDFDPGPGIFPVPNSGGSDIFILKLDAAGAFVWAKQMGGANTELGDAITVDAAGNIYTTGYFMGEGDYDPGPGVFSLSSISNTAIFISKLNASGNFVWAKSFGGTVSDPKVNVGQAIITDANQNVYVACNFVFTVDFDPGPGIFNLTSVGWWDISLAVLDAAGNFITAKQIGGNYVETPLGLLADGNGNIYMVGDFSTVTDFDPCSGTLNLTSKGAVDIFTAKFAAPVINISASTTSACQGTAVTFNAVVTNEGPAPAYQWKVNSVNVGTNSSTFTSSTLNNNDQVSCILMANASCVPPVTDSSNVIIMTIEPGGIPSVTIIASNTTICTGTTVSFTATPVNGGSAPIYQWQINGVNTGPNAVVFTVNTLSNNDLVSVVMTNSSPCVSPNTAVSNSILMQVNAGIAPSVRITASANSICPGIPVSFTALPANTGSAPSYQWKLNGNNVGTNSANYTLSNPANNDQVYCVMNSISGCSPNPLTNSDTITMIIHPVPVITFNPINPTIAPGNSVQLQASLNSSYSSLLWTPAVGLSSTSTLNPVANPSVTTTYKLDAFTANNCNCSNTITVTVISEIYIPNAFTPDGNGINDVFRIPAGSPITLKNLQVYNRYGNLVFYTSNISSGWDGTFKRSQSPAGAYNYIIEGLNDKGQSILLTGSVLLIR